MRVVLGSKNPSKIRAMEIALKDYEMFENSTFEGIEVETGVCEQPLSQEETIQGAINRAKNVFENYKKGTVDYAIGLESGFQRVELAETNYMEFGVCAIYDGNNVYLGFTPSFECPKEIMYYVINQGMDLSQASKAAKYTNSENLGKKQGIVGILTEGRVDRTEYAILSIKMAMTRLYTNNN